MLVAVGSGRTGWGSSQEVVLWQTAAGAGRREEAGVTVFEQILAGRLVVGAHAGIFTRRTGGTEIVAELPRRNKTRWNVGEGRAEGRTRRCF